MTTNRCRTIGPNRLAEDPPQLLERLPDEEGAFTTLVRREQGAMLNVARRHVPSHAVAEEVVQETWLAVLQGIERFEGRSSLRTWIFRILVNRAKTRGATEHRAVPLSALRGDESIAEDELVPARRSDTPAEHVVGHELREQIDLAMSGLPPQQRAVMNLRGLEGLSSEEVCARLDLSRGNQRVLLHRARCSMRRALVGSGASETAYA
jgi:RNA polymerase sigma-70 factor (ECF subfamily)